MSGSRTFPTLRSMAIASLIDDVTLPSQLHYIVGRCREREQSILLNMCREVLPDLVSIDYLKDEYGGIGDTYYTFSGSRFVVSTNSSGHLHVRSYENVSGEPLTPGGGGGSMARARWQELQMPCPVTFKMHLSIVARIVKWKKL